MLGGIAVAAGLIHGCRTPKDAEYPLTSVCEEQTRLQATFVELARQSLVVYGRIDPLLFQIDAAGKLGVDPNAKERAENSREGFQKVLAEIEADPIASKAFQENLKQATQLCSGGGCEPRNYDIEVRQAESKHPDIYGYTWEFQTDAPPSETQLKAFELLYTYPVAQGSECGGPDPIEIKDPTHGVLFAAASLRCKVSFPPPQPGYECTPPAGGEWIEVTFLGVQLLCCL